MHALNDGGVAPAGEALTLGTAKASRGHRRALSAAVVVTIAISQAIPAIQLLLSGQHVPLPLAIGSANFVVVLAVLSLADRVLPCRASSKPRLFVGATLGVLAGGAFATFLWTGAVPGITPEITPEAMPTFTMAGSFLLGAAISVSVVGAWSLAVIVPRVLESEKLRTLQVATLELEATRLRTQAELARLRNQLEPHFLLNTLNMISGLVGVDVEKARRALANLGTLVRDTLEEHGEVQTVEEEVGWLQRYCEILQVRHGPSLEITWDVDDEAREALVPRLVLQPLVENAVVHGALRAAGTGRVLVRVRREGGEKVVCTVEDNGPGPSGPTRPGAVGLENVRRRLEITRPGSSLDLETTGAGTRAVLELPYVTGSGKQPP